MTEPLSREVIALQFACAMANNGLLIESLANATSDKFMEAAFVCAEIFILERDK